MRTIMVIPGTAAQIPVIKRIKELGYDVVCVNPYEKSPAFSYADYAEQYDILDVDACIRIAQKYNVCAVISDECDIAMPTVAAVSEALNLPSIGSKLAKLYTNKNEMRSFSEEHGFPYPKYKQCLTLDEAKLFFYKLDKKKMIIKPLDSNSSRGVYIVNSLDDLENKFEESIKFSHSINAVLCEEYIEGTEFTIDGIVLNGKHYSLAVSKKKHYVHHPNIACELYFSHTSQEFDYDRLRNQNNKYVETSGLLFGFTHAEYKYNGSEFILIEIGARGGGNYISSHIVPAMTGLDNYGLLIGHTLDHEQYHTFSLSDEYKKRCCVLKFFDVDMKNNGKKVAAILGMEYMEKNPRILLHQFNFSIGDSIRIADDDSKRVGFYIAYGESKEELDQLMYQIEKKVIIQFE